MAEEAQTLTRPLTITAADWNTEAEHVLLLAVDSLADVTDLKGQVDIGLAALFNVSCCGEFVGAYILRVDSLATGPEGVIVAAAGHMQGVPLIRSLLPYIEQQFRGVSRWRIHTSKPGIARMLESDGYRQTEIVMRKDTHAA